MEKSKYKKCENYPQCTFVECECHQSYLFKKQSKSRPLRTHENIEIKTIIGFEIINGKAHAIFEDNKK